MFDWFRKKTAVVSTVEATEAVESHVDALIAQADAAREQGNPALAIDLYAAAHKLGPRRLYALYWLATLLQDVGNLADASAYGERGLALDPDQIGLCLRMGSIAHAMQDPAAALRHYEHAAKLDADVPGLDRMLADQLCFQGRLKEGVAAFDRAISRAPDSLELQQARLFCLNYSDLLKPTELAEEHRAWGLSVESKTRPFSAPAMAADPHKSVLSIGYVSGDMRNHAVANFVLPLFQHHDRRQFKVSVFDTSPDAEDWMGAQLRRYADDWQNVHPLDDESLAHRIRDAGIDILVDLSGHTTGNRLPVFARKPAPVQVSWLGYLNTTGLSAMDYRLTDALMDPPGLTETLHVEELVRLPIHACFAPSPAAPPVAPSPLSLGNPPTFGSVNQWPKVSLGAKALWASILVALPDARLRIIARGGQNPVLQRSIAAEFEGFGVRQGQVQVFPFSATADFLAFLGTIDVALDPFPYGGGTTTLQCLWMGVPVVTLAGRTAMSRNSIGPLTGVGLGDLVAATPSEYRERAIALARDPARLSRLRAELRPRMASSELMDGVAFATSVEAAYRTMWARYSA